MSEPTFQDVAYGDHEPDAGQGIHHPIFGLVLKEKMDALGVECVVRMREDVLEEDQGAIQAQFYRETVEFLKRQFEMG